jgi:hypothetical protein
LNYQKLSTALTVNFPQEWFDMNHDDHFWFSWRQTVLRQLLIDNGFDGKRGPKADCYMCHRGDLKPKYKEKVDPILGK